MGIEKLQQFNVPLSFQDSVVDKIGWPVTVYQLKDSSKQSFGYEDFLGITWATVKVWINLNVERRVFYHYNYFPEEGKEGVTSFGIFASNFPVQFGMFIRTKVVENVSPLGDLVLKVVKVNDSGMFKSLQRSAFFAVMSDRILYESLIPQSINLKGTLKWQKEYSKLSGQEKNG